jgi:RNA polymerase sigma factor (sigma-70 family)
MSGAPTKSANSPLGLAPATLKKYSAALHSYLLHRLRRRREDTADLTQEIFERFLRKRDRPEVIRDPLAYLYGIASHVVAETIEQEPHKLVTYDSALADHVAQTHPELQAADFARQLGLRADILQALSKLPEAHLTALVLVEGDGLSCKEAARVTGYTPSTIKTYLMHARATLKELLEDYEGRTA